jgi:hypothetical protein
MGGLEVLGITGLNVVVLVPEFASVEISPTVSAYHRGSGGLLPTDI